MSADDELQRMEMAVAFLPEPGGEVVRDLIERLRKAQEGLIEIASEARADSTVKSKACAALAESQRKQWDGQTREIPRAELAMMLRQQAQRAVELSTALRAFKRGDCWCLTTATSHARHTKTCTLARLAMGEV